MRNFPLLYITLFLCFYTIISLTTLLGLKKLPAFINQKKLLKLLNSFYIPYCILLFFAFLFLYIFPYNAREPAPYKAYFNFNSLLIADILIKIIFSVSTLLYFLFSSPKKKRFVFLYSGVIISAGITGSIIAGATLGKKQIEIQKAELEFGSLPQAFDGFKIVQISDMHVGSFSKNSEIPSKSVNLINRLSPNLIVFTGDLVNNFRNEVEGWQSEFSKLKAQYGIYSILGNHDYGDYTDWQGKKEKDENFEKIVSAHNKIGFKLLRNSFAPIVKNSDTIYLAGVENWGHPPFPQYADMEKAFKGIPDTSFKILLSHDPSHWESKIEEKENVHLTLSGHTHGLQWGIKPAGIELSLIYFGRNKWGGLYSDNGQYLYVNRGLGTIGINMRLDMPAEVSLITLKKK